MDADTRNDTPEIVDLTTLEQDRDYQSSGRQRSARTDPSMRDGDSGHGNPYEYDPGDAEPSTDSDVGDETDGMDDELVAFVDGIENFRGAGHLRLRRLAFRRGRAAQGKVGQSEPRAGDLAVIDGRMPSGGLVLRQIGNGIFNVIRRLLLVQLQVCLGPLHFCGHSSRYGIC